ncbi:MAG: AEC family transporter [Anaerolineae bacterium]|nr:AEC family transporter [Anaerolineae bacterium]MCO5197676.1 AEC family transporter [Anaerolineae bacterium]
MSAILDVLVNNILPIFLVAAFGFLLRRRVPGLSKQTVTRVTFYVLSPCLVFSSLVSTQLTGSEIGRIAFVAAASILIMGGIGWGIGRMLRFGREDIILLVLAAMFGNIGNMGLPFNQLRYGDDGVARAIIFMFVSAVLVYTIGVFVTSLGKHSWRSALTGTLRLPVVYAVALALLFYSLPISVPAPVMTAVDITGSGAIPVMLLLLGMNMADAGGITEWRVTLSAATAKLIIAPLVTFGIALAIGLTGLARNVSIIESAMPVAVATIVLTTEYNVKPETMTGIVVFSTLLSPITLLGMITLLNL